jgi:hypothetical protein
MSSNHLTENESGVNASRFRHEKIQESLSSSVSNGLPLVQGESRGSPFFTDGLRSVMLGPSTEERGARKVNFYSSSNYDQVSKQEILTRMKDRAGNGSPSVVKTASFSSPSVDLNERGQTAEEMYEEISNSNDYILEAAKSGLLFRDEIALPLFLPTKYEVDSIDLSKVRKQPRLEVDSGEKDKKDEGPKQNEMGKGNVEDIRELIYCRYPALKELYKQDQEKRFSSDGMTGLPEVSSKPFWGLTFSSNFESGNVFCVESVIRKSAPLGSPEEYDIFLCCDPIYNVDEDDVKAVSSSASSFSFTTHSEINTLLKKHQKPLKKTFSPKENQGNKCFFFRIENTKRKLYRFNIHYLSRSMESLYVNGMRPLMISEFSSDHDNIGWMRTGEDITFQPCHQGRLLSSSIVHGPTLVDESLILESTTTCVNSDYHTLSFTWHCNHPKDVVYFASSPLYTYSQLQSLLLSLSLKNSFTKNHIQVRRIARTPAGNQCDLCVITDNNSLIKTDEEGLISAEEEALKLSPRRTSSFVNTITYNHQYCLKDVINPPRSHSILATSIATANAVKSFVSFSEHDNELKDTPVEPLDDTEKESNRRASGFRTVPKFLQKLQQTLDKNLEKERKRKQRKLRKPAVIIVSRFLPFETSASWICEGIMRFLLSDNEYAMKLRKAFVFYIFPMINVDGVINGFSSADLCGQDLRKQWFSSSASSSFQLNTSIIRMKQVIQRIHQSTTIAGFFHIQTSCFACNTLSSNGFFLHSTPLPPIKVVKPEEDTTDEADLEAQQQYPVSVPEFYSSLTNRSLLLSMKSCSIQSPRYPVDSMRFSLSAEYAIQLSFAVHSSLFRGYNGSSYSHRHLRPIEYARFGGELCLALGDVYKTFSSVESLDNDNHDSIKRRSPTLRHSSNSPSGRASTAARFSEIARKSTGNTVNISDIVKNLPSVDYDEPFLSVTATNVSDISQHHHSFLHSSRILYSIGDTDFVKTEDSSSLNRNSDNQQTHDNDKKHHNRRDKKWVEEQTIELETSSSKTSYNESIWDQQGELSEQEDIFEIEHDNGGKKRHQMDDDEDEIDFQRQEMRKKQEIFKLYETAWHRALTRFFRRAEQLGLPKLSLTAASPRQANLLENDRVYRMNILNSSFDGLAVSGLERSQRAVSIYEIVEKKRVLKEKLRTISKKNIQNIISTKFQSSMASTFSEAMSDEQLSKQLQAKLDEAGGRTQYSRSAKKDVEIPEKKTESPVRLVQPVSVLSPRRNSKSQVNDRTKSPVTVGKKTEAIVERPSSNAADIINRIKMKHEQYLSSNIVPTSVASVSSLPDPSDVSSRNTPKSVAPVANPNTDYSSLPLLMKTTHNPQKSLSPAEDLDVAKDFFSPVLVPQTPQNFLSTEDLLQEFSSFIEDQDTSNFDDKAQTKAINDTVIKNIQQEIEDLSAAVRGKVEIKSNNAVSKKVLIIKEPARDTILDSSLQKAVAASSSLSQEEVYQLFVKELGLQYEQIFGRKGLFTREMKRRQQEEGGRPKSRGRSVSPSTLTTSAVHISNDGTYSKAFPQRNVYVYDDNNSSNIKGVSAESHSPSDPSKNTFFLRYQLFQYYQYIVQQLTIKQIVPSHLIEHYANTIFQNIYSRHQLFLPKKLSPNPPLPVPSTSAFTSPRKKTSPERAKLAENSNIPNHPATQQIQQSLLASHLPHHLLQEESLETKKKRKDDRFRKVIELQKRKAFVTNHSDSDDPERLKGQLPVWIPDKLKDKFLLKEYQISPRKESEEGNGISSSWITGFNLSLSQQPSLLDENSLTKPSLQDVTDNNSFEPRNDKNLETSHEVNRIIEVTVIDKREENSPEQPTELSNTAVIKPAVTSLTPRKVAKEIKCLDLFPEDSNDLQIIGKNKKDPSVSGQVMSQLKLKKLTSPSKRDKEGVPGSVEESKMNNIFLQTKEKNFSILPVTLMEIPDYLSKDPPSHPSSSSPSSLHQHLLIPAAGFFAGSSGSRQYSPSSLRRSISPSKSSFSSTHNRLLEANLDFNEEKIILHPVSNSSKPKHSFSAFYSDDLEDSSLDESGQATEGKYQKPECSEDENESTMEHSARPPSTPKPSFGRSGSLKQKQVVRIQQALFTFENNDEEKEKPAVKWPLDNDRVFCEVMMPSSNRNELE